MFLWLGYKYFRDLQNVFKLKLLNLEQKSIWSMVISWFIYNITICATLSLPKLSPEVSPSLSETFRQILNSGTNVFNSYKSSDMFEPGYKIRYHAVFRCHFSVYFPTGLVCILKLEVIDYCFHYLNNQSTLKSTAVVSLIKRRVLTNEYTKYWKYVTVFSVNNSIW